MSWGVEFSELADKDLENLDTPVKKKVIEKIDWLAENFENVTPVPLKGEFRDFYKLRVGDWRVFYRVDWEGRIIFVAYIKNRDSAYR